jgi:RNA polymerase sigma-70 factor (ECF subfamily)
MNTTIEEVTTDAASNDQKSLENYHLVCAAQAGSSAAFGELRDIYSRRVYLKLLSITKNKEDAEDALQDAFLRAYLALHAFEGRSSFYSWLTRIAINSALMTMRKRRARPEVSFDHPHEVDQDNSFLEFKDAGPNPEQICFHRQRCARVIKAIGKLQPRLRQVIEMQMRQSWTVREIARSLEISEAAVKSRLFRARARLASSQSLRTSDAKMSTFRGPLADESAA